MQLQLQECSGCKKSLKRDVTPHKKPTFQKPAPPVGKQGIFISKVETQKRRVRDGGKGCIRPDGG
jgi:hypothetical protein